MPNSSLALPALPALAGAQAKRARRKDARPGELLAAALELFAEKGFAATRAEEVAARAGVSKGTLFLYFSSKEELFKAVVRENISNRFPDWGTELEAFEGPTPELLRHAMNTWWARVGNTRASGILKLIMGEAQNFPALADFYQREVVMPGQRLLGRILRRGVERGEFRPLDMQYAVYALLAPMLFLVVSRHAGGQAGTGPLAQIVPEDYIAAQVDILLQGLRVPAGPGGAKDSDKHTGTT